METIEIGLITKAQALKGEFRLKLYSNNNSVFNKINYLLIEEEKYLIEYIKNRVSFVVVKLQGFDNIESIKNLISKKVYIYKKDLKLEKGDYLIDELISFLVINEENVEIGKVIEINNFGAGDIYTLIKENNKTVQFVNARNIIKKIDKSKKTITVNQDLFNELSVE